MDRRRFIRNTAAVGALAAGAHAAPAISKERIEWRMVTAWPKGLPGLGTGAENLGRRITQMSGGRLTVRVFAAGELVPGLQTFEAVQAGTAEMGHDTPGFHLGKHRAFAYFFGAPYGMSYSEHIAWLRYGGGQALWDELSAQFGLKSYAIGNIGTPPFGWFKKPLNSLEDFRGVKMRLPGLGAEMIRRLGAVPTLMAPGDVFPALQAGTLDATDFTGPANDMALGFHQVCKYYYSPGYHEAGPNLQLMINERAWAALSPDLQAIVRTACAAATRDMLAEYNARSGPALRSLVKDHGVIVRPLPEDVLMACGEKSNEVLNEIYAADTSPDRIVRRIIEDFLAFRQEILPWTRVGEQAYLNARRLPFEFKLR